MTPFEDLNLFHWWDPTELVRRLAPSEQPEDGWFIADRKFQKHNEAWIAAHFAVGYSKLSSTRTLVKMVPEEERYPDATLRCEGSKLRDVGVQITAVMEPGRTLRADYRKRIEAGHPGRPRPYRIPNPEEIAAWVNAALAGKVLSADRRTWLVVYLNTWVENAEFTKHVKREHLCSWGAVYVLSSAGNAVLALKGDGAERWQPFEV